MSSIYTFIGAIYVVLLIFIGIVGFMGCLRLVESKATIRLLKYPCWGAVTCAAVILYAYFMEIFVAYYSGSQFELEAFKLRVTGPYWYAYLFPILTHILVLLVAIPRLRKNLTFVTISAIVAAFSTSGLFETCVIKLTS